MRSFALAILVVCAAARGGWADILQWTDAGGTTHYTNLKSEVPKDRQASTEVLVDESARRTAASEAAPASAPDPVTVDSQPRREAEVIYDQAQLASVYMAGLRQGLDASRGVNAGGSVQINGPLAISNASAPAPYGYGPGYYYPYYPLVSTSFDRGRSRYRTLRMLLQDQFAIDRDGPFVFEERLVPPFGHPPLGVALNPLLPRGLPYSVPPEGRVIIR